jgi:hypothetical protein
MTFSSNTNGRSYEIVGVRRQATINGEGMFFVTYTVFDPDGSESHKESYPVYARDELEVFQYWTKKMEQMQ